MPRFAAAQARFGSGPLNSSVQNETDAAIDRATSWLVKKQSPQGYWGSTNLKTTAVCAIAVHGDRSEYTEDETNCLAKALSWIKGRQETNAWGNTAIALLDGKFGGDLSGIFSEFAPGLDTNDVAAAFVAAATKNDKTFDNSGLAIEWSRGLARKWYNDPESGWWLARSINTAASGELALPAKTGDVVNNINWRGALARKWILSQRVDGTGDGHWDDSPEKTAFAILLLSEL